MRYSNQVDDGVDLSLDAPFATENNKVADDSLSCESTANSSTGQSTSLGADIVFFAVGTAPFPAF